MIRRKAVHHHVAAPPSRAGPPRGLYIGAMLTLCVAGTADGQQAKPVEAEVAMVPAAQSDSGKTAAASTAKAGTAMPKWFDEIAVNAFASTAYVYNSNRPGTGSSSYRVFDFIDNSFNLDVAELVVQIAPSKPNDAGFRIDFAAGNSVPQIS